MLAAQIIDILKQRDVGMTVAELVDRDELIPYSFDGVSACVRRLYRQGKLERAGQGVPGYPYFYSLKEE
jgi:hypothetical protein